MSAKRSREDWCNIIDLIAADDSRIDFTQGAEILRAELFSSTGHGAVSFRSYLPRPVSNEVKEYVAVASQQPAVLSAHKVYEPQTSFLEALHARPLVKAHTPSLGQNGVDGPDFKAALSKLTKELSTRLKSDAVENSNDAEKLSAGMSSKWMRNAQYNPSATPHFMPIILVPSGPSSPIQLQNVIRFLEDGKYEDPASMFVGEKGDTTRLKCKPTRAVADPGSFVGANKYKVAFRKFLVMDDPAEVKDWSQVCACFVTGKDWQFEGWFPQDANKREPSFLFQEIRGFLPYFEEDKIPPKLKAWNVSPIVLNRKSTKTNASIHQAATFWGELYKFLDTNPRFRHFTIPQVSEL